MIDKQTAPHYSWGDGCDGWRLVRTETLSIIEERMPPGACEVRHYHRGATQFFYVLQGALSIEVDGSERELSQGQGIPIPAGQVHHVRNQSAMAAGFLVVSNPPAQADRVPAEPLP